MNDWLDGMEIEGEGINIVEADNDSTAEGSINVVNAVAETNPKYLSINIEVGEGNMSGKTVVYAPEAFHDSNIDEDIPAGWSEVSYTVAMDQDIPVVSATVTAIEEETTYDFEEAKTITNVAEGIDDINGEVIGVVEAEAEYTITTSVTNGTYTGDNSITASGTASVTITPNEGYELPSTVTVTGSAHTYDDTTGVISLSSATGNVTITAVCTAVTPPAPTTYTVTTNVTNGSASGDNSIEEDGTASVTITANANYALPVSVTVTGASHTYDSTTGVVSLSTPTGDVTITAVCTEIPQSSLTPFAQNASMSGLQVDPEGLTTSEMNTWLSGLTITGQSLQLVTASNNAQGEGSIVVVEEVSGTNPRYLNIYAEIAANNMSGKYVIYSPSSFEESQSGQTIPAGWSELSYTVSIVGGQPVPSFTVQALTELTDYTFSSNKSVTLLSPSATGINGVVVGMVEAQFSGYTITTNVQNGTYSGDTTIAQNGTATVTIVPNADYALPQTVIVTGASQSYNPTTGVISLSNPTGNVTIMASCTGGSTPTGYTITTTVTNGSATGSTSIAPGGTATVIINANTGYTRPETVSVTNAQYTYNSTTGMVSLSNATGNVIIVASCQASAPTPGQYTITPYVQAGYGQVVPAVQSASAGTVVALTVTMYSQFYRVKTGTIKANNVVVNENNGVYSFTMPAENVVISAEFEEHWVVGVKIDKANSNPSSIQYTDAATQMAAPSVGNNGSFQDNGWSNTPVFSNIKPYLVKDGVEVCELDPDDYSKDTQGNSVDITSGADGDVMVKFPKMYYAITSDTDYYYVRLSNYQASADFTDYAFSYSGAVKDHFYVGAYQGYVDNSKLRSLSGKTPTTSTSLSDFRTAAKSNGTGYELLPYNKLILLQVLYLIRYRNLNSQTALGRGYTGGQNKIVTGGTNALGMNYGTNNSEQQIKCNGIEDFWGNVRNYIDGLYIDSNLILKIDDGTTGFNDAGTDYTLVTQLSSVAEGYISEIKAINKAAFMPSATNGSGTTYFSDYGRINASSVFTFGGLWGIYSLSQLEGYTEAGAFEILTTNANGSQFIGARLALCQ